MSEGVPWTPSFPGSGQKSDLTQPPNSYGPRPTVSMNSQSFPPPIARPGVAPGMNNPMRHQTPFHPPGQNIASGVQPPQWYSTGPPNSSTHGTGSSVFSQHPSSTSINGPLHQHMSNSEATKSNPTPHSSTTSSVSGVSSSLGVPYSNPSNVHSSSGAAKYSHPTSHFANSHPPISSNEASPTPSGGLPLPYNGMAQYTHPIRQDGSHESSGAATPTHGNQRSYQPSPVSTPQIDAIEGQFSLQKQLKQNQSSGLQGSSNVGSANHSRSGSGASYNQFPTSLSGYQPSGNSGAYQSAPPPPSMTYQASQPTQHSQGTTESSSTVKQEIPLPQMMPPPSQPNIPPTSNQPGFPPSNGQRMFPPSTGQPGVPPSNDPRMFPPPIGQPGFPPSSQPGFPPPSSQPGISPPNSQPGFPPSSSKIPPSSIRPGYPNFPPSGIQPRLPHGPPSSTGQPLFPPSSQPRFAQPTGQPGYPQPPGQPNVSSADARNIFPPSVNPPGLPPNTGSMSGPMPPGNQVEPPMPGSRPLKPPSHPGMAPNSAPTSGLHTTFSKLNLGPNRIVNLLQERILIPPNGIETVKPHFGSEYRDHTANCAPEIMRLTLNSLPQTSSLLNKARLPLGLHLHPFRDLSTIPVIQASVIVRCKSCRTYINPFVVFLDQRRWRCNICFRQNEVPNEFQFDPVSRQYGDPQRRPEVKSATVEFIAPSEYMLRPPQPAVYLFVLDVSRQALSGGYLPLFCHTVLDYLNRLPGDSRTHIGFITFNSGLQFYKLDEERGPRMLLVNDIEDVFLPDHSGLVVNLGQHKETVEDLLNNLPESFKLNETSTGNCLGAALQAALKLVGPTGGRVTVLNCGLPESGPGALKVREDPNQRAAPKSVAHLGPATDFYKALALECAGQQVAVDLFLLTNAYADFATILGISRHSGGSVRVYPNFSDEHVLEMARFRIDLRRYLSRKIGFEAVMRVRCTRGIAITAFYGNFFVRSTDLLSLPNVSPDAGYSIQMKIEDSLTDLSSVSFQAALLYTSSKGERRIRVHTLTVPTTGLLEEVFRNADHTAVSCLLAKMAAERSVESGIREAREALVNAVLDVMKAYGDVCLSSAQRIGSLGLPYNLRLLPLFVLSILKSRAFRLGVSTKLDDRVAMMEMFKALPPTYLLPLMYPRLYRIHGLVEEPEPVQLHASAQFTERNGAYLLDAGEYLFILVGKEAPTQFINDVFGVPDFDAIPDGATELPERDTPASERLRQLIFSLRDDRPIGMALLVIKDESRLKSLFSDRLMDDRSDQLMAYTEFLQYLQSHVKYSS